MRRVFARLAAPQRKEEGLSLAQRLHLHRLLEERAASGIAPSELAASLQLSPDYFARQFRHSFGIAPRTWIKRERVRLAAQTLLESNLSVKEVAHHFGFSDIFLFSRQFKQVTGQSPSAYRAARQGDRVLEAR